LDGVGGKAGYFVKQDTKLTLFSNDDETKNGSWAKALSSQERHNPRGKRDSPGAAYRNQERVENRARDQRR
jgi:hypothetical protein